MGQTITEKILALHADRAAVQPGDNVWVAVDVLMTHDVCGPGTIGVFEREFGADARVFDLEKVVIIPDHYIYTLDPMCQRNVVTLREFARRQGLRYFYDPDTEAYKGVCHVGLAQEGHARPGEVMIGTDSHTCTSGAFGEFATGVGNTDAGFALGTGRILLKVPPTLRFVIEGELPAGVMAKDIILRIIGQLGVDGATYCAMEFAGSCVAALSMEERMTLCNMAIEAGAKNGIIAPDATTREYVKARTHTPFIEAQSDRSAAFAAVHTYAAHEFVPAVAKPHSPDNYAPAAECSAVKIDRAYIGSCTGGKTSDFLAAAQILHGRRVSVDTFLVPATRQVERDLQRVKLHGTPLARIFSDAGCQPIAPPNCAACLGGPVDTYGRTRGAEVVISTTNRNFPGRMGSPASAVFLASPYTVAASAVRGVITDPREFV